MESSFASIPDQNQRKRFNRRHFVIGFVLVACVAAVLAVTLTRRGGGAATDDSSQSRLQKPGMCPTVRAIGSCAFQCMLDSHCNGGEKCCFNGCGYSCSAVEAPTTNVRVQSTSASSAKLSVGGPNPDGTSTVHPTVLRYSLSSGDIEPNSWFKSRFDNEFKQQFINWANNAGLTYNGDRLNIINAAILGFPPTPIPTEGHVTHDFMTQTGGLNFYVSQPMEYEILNPSYIPTLVQQVLYKQDSDAPAVHKMTYSQSFTSSQTFTVTSGISSEISMEVSVGVPDLGLGSKLSTKITSSLTSSKASTQSSTDTWSSEEDITIPAHTITNGTCFITSGQLDSAFHGALTATGDSPVGWVFWDDKYIKGDTPWFWFFQTQQTVDGLMGYARSFGSSFNFDVPVTGVYHGTAATRVQCEVHSCPYSPTVDRCYN